MSGYQEVLTDPSYAGQIVVMTFPLIGNTGVNAADHEAPTPRAAGLVVRRLSRYTTNHRAEETLGDFLGRHRLPVAEELDTRAITRHLRIRGAMRAVLATDERARLADPALVELARAAPGLGGVDLATRVSRVTPARAAIDGSLHPIAAGDPFAGGRGPRVLLVDYGVKAGIARSLAARGARVVVVPGAIDATEALALAPDGVVLSNGPGDPEPVTSGIRLARELIGKLPILGICLGHQLLGLGLGLEIEKLHFGHRGANHPVLELASGRVLITSQNHGYTVVASAGANGGSADGKLVDGKRLTEGIEVTHRSLFDGTLEGLRHRALQIRSVQFHPEASPGPHDASPIFDRFLGDVATPSRAAASDSRPSSGHPSGSHPSGSQPSSNHPSEKRCPAATS
jgi:carbamoyl-phosphate synthase small subunit